MIEPLIISSSLLLGKEVLTHTITTSTKNICNGINSILLNRHFEFKKILNNLDINTKLDIIEQFIKDINYTSLSQSSIKILKYLKENIILINNEIVNINNEILNHKTKWFSSLRTSNCHEMIINLTYHVQILDDRFNLLIKLINYK